MGYQQREQREFLGLQNRRIGATAPRWSAQQVENIDFTRDSIRGRRPTERLVSGILPALAIRYDGNSRSRSDYSANDLSLSTLTDTVTTESFLLRAYVSGLDLAYLANFAVGTSWVIAASIGSATYSGGTTSAGWVLRLVHSVQDEFEFQFLAGTVDKATGSTTLITTTLACPDIQDYWESTNDVFCVEASWNLAHTQQKLEFFLNGSNTASESNTGVIDPLQRMHVSGSHYLDIGGVSPSSNANQINEPLIGIVGSVTIFAVTGSANPTTRWHCIPEDPSLSSAYAQVALDVTPRGEGYSVDVVGQSAFTNTGAGKVYLDPPPALVSAGVLQFHPGSGAKLRTAFPEIENSKCLGIIGEVTVHAPAPGTSFGATWTGTIIGINALGFPAGFGSLRVIAPSVSGYRLEANVVCVTTGGTASLSSNLSSDLTPGTTYRFALFVERNFSVSDQVVTELWIKSGGTWTSLGTDTTGGSPQTIEGVDLQYMDAYVKGLRWDLGDLRFHANLSARPTTSAGVNAIDAYPLAGALGWNASTFASFDIADTDNLVTEELEDGRDRFLRIDDGKQGMLYISASPERRPERWSAIAHMKGSPRSDVFGIHTGAIVSSGRLVEVVDSAIRGGVWRYDVDSAVGKLIEHRQLGMAESLAFCDVKDRLLCFGVGVSAEKVFPSGIGPVGLEAPLYSFGTAVSSASNGGLAASTGYYYRISVSNSYTGEESNVGGYRGAIGAATGTTSIGHNTLTIPISYLAVESEDWDTINLYRRAQTSGLWHRELQIPRPKVLPPVGDNISIVSSLSETELLLQPVEEIDNYPPPDFSAGGIVGRSFVVGGGGAHPGWSYYSKPYRYESFPPLNVWQLNGDDSDTFVGVVSIASRAVIFKRRSIYAMRDDAADTGEEPMLVRDGIGCVNPRAMCIAGNLIYFLTADGRLYATDGIDMRDVSDPIHETMEALTDDQILGAQLAHHAHDQQVWLSVPSADSGPRREIFAFEYDRNRWTRFVVPHSSACQGSVGGGLRGEVVLIGAPGWVYKLGSGRQARDSDSSASVFSHDYAAAEFLDAAGTVYGFAKAGHQWEADIEGMPVVIVFYDGASFAGTPPRDHPLWRADSLIAYSCVQKVGVESPYDLWLTHPVPAADVYDRALVLVGHQVRRHLESWHAPQGEGLHYRFAGATFVTAPDQVHATEDATYRARFDHETFPTAAAYDATQTPDAHLPDHSFGWPRRARRIALEILSGTSRTSELDVRSIAMRYRVLGPRRVRR